MIDDLIELGADICSVMGEDNPDASGFDAVVTAYRMQPGRFIRRPHCRVRLHRFTGQAAWYACDTDDPHYLPVGTCAHFETRSGRITSYEAWRLTPEEIRAMLVEDKGEDCK